MCSVVLHTPCLIGIPKILCTMNTQTQNKAMSLHLLDWLVTKYTCEHNVCYHLKNSTDLVIPEPDYT